jgi:hypothetical protein
MAAVLKVKDDGAWRTVIEPYAKVDGIWKTVHNISIKHGGSWRLAHKTGIDQYVLVDDSSLIDMTTADSYTVAEGVRYLRVQLTAGSGRGGGSSSSASGYVCQSGALSDAFGTTYNNNVSVGGAGGHGGLVDVRFEVIPGEVYSWSGLSGGTGGGSAGGHLNLYTYSLAPDYVNNPPGTAISGAAGGNGDTLTFTGPSTTISAGGGLGGNPGVLTVSERCGTTVLGYVMSITNPSRTGHIANSITTTNLVETVTNGGASSGGGGGGAATWTGGGSGSNGGAGKISIWQYGKN